MKRIGRPFDLLAAHVLATTADGGGRIVVMDDKGVLWLADDTELATNLTLNVVSSSGVKPEVLAARLRRAVLRQTTL